MGNVSSVNDGKAGGLVGSNYGVVMNNYATGNVKGSQAGGLVGTNDNNDKKIKGTVENSYATGNVSGEYSAGGLVGQNNGAIINCYATGNVVANGDIKGRKAGGLIGSSYGGTISNSFAMGSVTGNTAGGLAGNNYGAIMNSYAMGNIIGNTSGGLVGKNEEKSTIENSYAMGSVNGTSSTIGGLVGENVSGTIAKSYYDRQTSGQSDIVKGEPKSTVQMKQQTIFQNWDFDKVWGIDGSKNDGYPYLQSNEKSLPVKYKYSNNVQQRNTLTDDRDGKKYKTVIINTQTWMAENLNYDAKSSKCYDNKPANCTKYGRLYNWTTSLKACPIGWHLPSKKEWEELDNYTNMYLNGSSTYLKATNGWKKYNNEDYNGTDYFGFAALPGGHCDGRYNPCQFIYPEGGYWWSSSPNEIDSNNAYNWSIYNSYKGYRYEPYLDSTNKANLYSVRCLHN